jgi:Uma2 family endonuclease
MGAELTLPRRTLSVEDYHRMGEAGLFRPEERLELINGDLITMAPIGWPHLQVVTVVAQSFAMQAAGSAIVLVQNPVSLPPDNEPQPDIALLRAEYRLRPALPVADDVLLVVEVADTTLERDRDVKVPLYARHRIPEAWLLDVKKERATIFRDPGPEGYGTVISPAPDAAISPLLRPDLSIPLAKIWPARAG